MRPKDAEDYYRKHEKEFRDAEVIALLALTEAVIDHRRAVEDLTDAVDHGRR